MFVLIELGIHRRMDNLVNIYRHLRVGTLIMETIVKCWWDFSPLRTAWRLKDLSTSSSWCTLFINLISLAWCMNTTLANQPPGLHSCIITITRHSALHHYVALKGLNQSLCLSQYVCHVCSIFVYILILVIENNNLQTWDHN